MATTTAKNDVFKNTGPPPTVVGRLTVLPGRLLRKAKHHEG